MTMKAIVKKEAAKGFVLENLPVPDPGEKEVLVKVKSAAICGSDLKLYEWTPWCKNVVKALPFIPGHECSGEVVGVGKRVTKLKLGDKAAAETHIPCGECWQCRHERPHTCMNMELFGHTVNGCFAEYFTLPETAVWKLASDFPLQKGCLLEPMGIPLRAVYEGEVEGDSVVVIGCGPIGQFAIGMAKALKAGIIMAFDINDKRLSIAKRMGATHVFNPGATSVSEQVMALTDGTGAGVIIEASGSADALKQAFGYSRVGGKLFVIGHPSEQLHIDVSPQIVLKEMKIIGLFGRELWKTWEIAQNLILEGKLNTDPVVTHRYPMEDFEDAFSAAVSGEGCKIVLTP
jgi:threonine 3-dehydrogenase